MSPRSLHRTSPAALWPVDARPITPERAHERVQRINALLESLLAASTVEQASRALLHHGGAALAARGGRVLLCVEEGSLDLEVVAAVGLPKEVTERKMGPELHTPAHDAFKFRQIIAVERAEDWARTYPALASVLTADGIASCVAVPLDNDGSVVGALEMVLDSPRVLSDDEKALLVGLARYGGRVLDRCRRTDADREARLQAERANQVKADFLAVVSHELRTPLNAIGGYTELMQMGLRGPLTPSQDEDLRRIEHSQRHLLSLVNAILNFAKLDAGRVTFTLVKVSACEVLEDIEPLVQPQARARQVKVIREECDPTLDVFADREKLQQVLLNLLTNAIKYTPSGGTIVMRCMPTRRHVSFQVTDTGVGIASDKLNRVFEPFVQVNRSLSAPNDGVGLGLAISRELARGMRGTLTCASTVGEGSTFTLTLPRPPREDPPRHE